jgi:short-subunit dehydrogenase
MQTILITGASDGIGQALAVRYAARGVRVLGVGRRAFPTSLTGSMLPQDYCAADLSNADVAETVGNFLVSRNVTHLDVLVHNAAIGWYGPVAQQSNASIDELLQVNLYVPIVLTHVLLPYLRVAHGVVAFISSVHSALPTPDFAVYTATKAGLDGFARNLRMEERGAVDVVILWPGPTRTQMHVKSGIPQERIKSKRYATPDDVAMQVAAAIHQRRSHVIGAGNRLLRWVAVHFESQVDALMTSVARRHHHG